MAVGAARSASRRRGPAGRRRHYRDRGARARGPGWLLSPLCHCGERDKRHALPKSQIRFHPRHRACRKHWQYPVCHGSQSIAFGQKCSRVHWLRQDQPEQDQHGIGRDWKLVPCIRCAIQGDGRRRLDHVPYRINFMPDLLSGQVQVAFTTITLSIEYIRAGKLRALAVTSANRSTALPDIPTVSEFVPGYDATGWYGVGAPKRTPADIVDKLNREVNAGNTKLKARLADVGVEPTPMTPAEFGKLIADDTEKWGKVIRAANIKPEV